MCGLFFKATASLEREKKNLDPPQAKNLLHPILYLTLIETDINVIYNMLHNMKKPMSYNATIIGERARARRDRLFKICHVTQIIASASLPPSLSFLSLFHPSNNPSSRHLLP